jgi:DNA-binding SARP family transcriptional activator/Tfp pilus assembly protein PilF
VGRLDFAVLGPLEVRCGGQPLPVHGSRERAVLAVLLLESGSVVPVGRLVGAVWDDDPPGGAEKAVRNCVSSLRRRFAEAGAPAGLIETVSAGYRLRLGNCDLDLHEFDRLVASGRGLAAAGEIGRAVAGLRAALALWRGPALAGVGGALIGAAAARLDERRMTAVEECIDLELALGRHRDVAAELRGYAAEWPLRERLAGQLMLALYRSGRQAEALDAFHRLAERLADDLGLGPSNEIARLHEAILRQDSALDLARTARNVEASDPDDPEKSRAGHQRRVPATQPVPAQLPLDVPGFTGRVAELARLRDLLAGSSARPDREMVVISAIGGTAGVGKTALAVHFAHQVADRFPDGQLYANLRGFDLSESPVSPSEALNGFLAAVGATPEAIPGDLDARAGLYRTLLRRKRVLVVLDNARDAGQVRPLLPGSPGCLVIVTSRSQLTGLAAAEGASLLTLDVLAEDEARDLLARRLGADRLDSEPDAARELTALCARLPLALSIVAARAASRPELNLSRLAAELRDTHQRLDALDTGDPATDVRAVFSWSYQQLTAPAARLFRLLGLHPGPDITAAAAASLAAIGEPEASSLLAELSRAHLVIEHARSRFAFHDLLRAYAAEQARDRDNDTDRRAATHRLLDYYLHTAHAASRPASPARRMISLPEPQPGVRPGRFSGNRDALAWFDAEYRVLLAAASLAADRGFDVHAWQLPWSLARFQQRRGYWHERVESQQLALAAAERLGDPLAQARVHHEIAVAYNQIGRDEDIVHAKLARELFERLGDIEGQGLALGEIGRTLERRGRWREALGYAQRYLELCQAAGNRALTANALNAIGWCCAHLGDYRRAQDCCEQALAIFRKSGDLLSMGWTSDTLGYAHYRAGDYAQAAARYRDAIRSLQGVGDRPARAHSLVRLGDVHDAAGDRQAAREAWREALVILEELHLPEADEVRAKFAP